MLRNITTSLKTPKYLRDNQPLRVFFVTYLRKNSVFSQRRILSGKIPNKTGSADPTVPGCGKLRITCGKG
jgi:hypothetical protein